jgi:mersacidin/lichenicidin family type 2 lantibiotic
MSTYDIIRAWKDEEYRDSLSEAERAALPQHPAGQIELSDTELETVAGGGLFTLLSYCFLQEICRTH